MKNPEKHRRQSVWGWGLLCLLALPLAGHAATVSLSPASVADPAPGQVLSLQLEVEDAPAISGALVTVIFDPTYYTLESFVAGALLEGVDQAVTVTPAVDSIAVGVVGGVRQDGTLLPGGTGVLGTVNFRVRARLPVPRDFISLLSVQFIAGQEPVEPLAFLPGELGLEVTRRFANRIFNFDVDRRHDGVNLAWQSRFPGIDDTLRYRAVGKTEFSVALNPLLAALGPRQVEAVRLLAAAGVDARTATDEEVFAVLEAVDFSPVSAALVDSLRQAQERIALRRRSIGVEGLEPQTEYEYRAHSVALDGRPSPFESGTFRTRSAPDVRPIVGTDVDVQSTATTASASWLTNRPADTRFAVSLDEPGADTLQVLFDAADGTQIHNAPLSGLLPGRRYNYLIRSRLVGVESLVAQGLLDSSQIWLVKTGSFRTRAGREPLRLLQPPTQVLGPESAVIQFRLNQITDATVEYGLVPEGSAKITRGSQADDAQLYVWTQASTDLLDVHTITLSALQPSTRLRYRIRVVTPDGDTLSTDPRGNEQWSRDLQFVTAAAGDTLPPRIVEGPAVIVRDVLAVVRFATDVETRARVFFGTAGGTYGTADEFEVIDQTPDGNPRFSQEHSVTIGGLEPGLDYVYGIEMTAANGKTSSFEPSLNVAKAVGVLQPPGGAGRFVTRSVRDTRFPVILSGPTVVSKTHRSAVVEWTTDEPANSELRFGVGSMDDAVTSGSNKTRHRLTLSNLAPGTAYRYLVASVDASGNGATESPEAVFETDPQVDLAAPVLTTAPRAIHRTERSATLQWATDEVATGSVEFGPTADLGFRRKLQQTGRRHRITLTNLEAATEYFYRVEASDLSNNGPTQSPLLSFVTEAEPDATPPTISNVQVAADRDRAIIRWRTDELADSFVDFGVGSSGLTAAKMTQQERVRAFFQEGGLLDQKTGSIEDVEEHEIVLTNLEPGTTYFFRTGSVDPSDNPPVTSDVLSFTTPSVADAEAPAAPQGLAATAGFERARLSWRANAELDLAGYNLYRRQGAGDFEAVATRLLDTTYVDPGLQNGTPYSYRVTAVDRAPLPNESDPGEAVEVTPSSTVGPSRPAPLAVQGAALQPTLVFADAVPARDGAALSYTVQVSTREDFGNVTASVSDLLPQSGGQATGRTAWTLPRTLRSGQAYFWKVQAVEDGLAGAFSEVASFVAGQAGIAADFNGDGVVDFDDFFAFADVFGQAAVGAAAPFDLDGDGEVGFGDFFLFADLFGLGSAGKSWAAPTVLDEDAVLWPEARGGGRADGGEVVVKVWARDVKGVEGFGLVLEYDAEALRFIDARPGAGHMLASRGGEAPLFRVLGRYPGQVVVGNALIGGEAVAGSGLLAELRFGLKGARQDVSVDLTDAFFAADGQVARVVQLGSARLLPRAYRLGANFPNPFNPATSIEYALPVPGPVRLTVYDVLGRQVRTLVRQQTHAAGVFTALWDGRDAAGRSVGSGVYFYRLAAGKFSQTRRMTLVK